MLNDGVALNVLMYSTYFPPEFSGAAKQALSLAKSLRDRGHNIEFITVRWPGLPEKDVYEGFSVYRIKAGRGNRHKEWRLWWNFFRFVFVNRHEFDILHSHGAYYTNSIVGLFGKLFGIKSLVKASLVDNDLHSVGTGLTGKLHKFLLNLVDAYIAISPELCDEFCSAGLPPSKCRLWSNGVDTRKFFPIAPEEKTKLKNKLGIPVGSLLALSVGVFDRRKNIGWLMEEWVGKNDVYAELFLLCIGPQSREDKDGSFFSSLKSLAEIYPDRLGVMGHVENIEDYYRAADMFVLPSISEGMPNVILEAMASGLPCIATDVSGTRELVVDGITGYLFIPGDSDGLSHSVNKLLLNLNEEMSQVARRIVEKEYSIDALALKYECLYTDLLTGIKTISKQDIED